MKPYIILALLVCLAAASCRSAPRDMATGASPDNQSLPRLITDYAGMKETPIVAFAWADSSFKIEDCSEVRISSVENLSGYPYAQAPERIRQALQDSLAARAKQASGPSVVVTAAITGMRGKPGIIKRFNPTYEDSPSIELELVIAESGTNRELVKLCHMERGKDTAQAVDRLIEALKLYFKKKL